MSMKRGFMKSVLGQLIICMCIGSASFAHAVLIYDNGANVNNGVFSDPDIPQLIADNFSLSPGLNQITEIRWTGLYSPDLIDPDNFLIQFFADEGGLPSQTPLVSLFIGDLGRTDTGLLFFGDSLFGYSAQISPITLAPNTTFWLSIVNDTSAEPITEWAWGTQLIPPDAPFFGGIAGRSFMNSPWDFSRFFIQDFELLGPSAIPEPSSGAMLLLGFLGLLHWVRLRARMRIRHHRHIPE